jgi:hypothetical protein
MKFPKTPYLNQKFNPSAASTISYVWTGFAWDIYTDPLGNPISEANIIKRSSYEINGEIPLGMVDGTNTEFTLSKIPIAESDSLYLNGLRQIRDLDYTITENIINMSWSPYSGSKLLCNYEVIGNLAIEGEIAVLLDDGVFTKYSLTHAPTPGTERVFINGLRATFGSEFDYTLDGKNIIINYELNEFSRILCDYNY